MSSLMMGDVDAKVGVYFMSNSGAPASIAFAALALQRGEEYVPGDSIEYMGSGATATPERKAITVDRRTLGSYVGRYVVDPATVYSITRQDGGLLLRVNGQSAVTTLLAETPTRFFANGASLTVEFSPGQLVLEKDGERKVARKPR